VGVREDKHDLLLGAMAGAYAEVSMGLLWVQDHLAQRQAAEQRLAAGLRYAPILPITLTPPADAIFQNAEIWGPKTGYFWAVQRVSAAGLSAGGNSVDVSGSVTSPGAFANIVSAPGLTPGQYTVTAQTETSGTTGPAELNNMRLVMGPGNSLPLAVVPGGTASNGPFLVTVPASTGSIIIQSAAATPTTGAVYSGVISYQSAPDTLNLYRGQPVAQDFLQSLTAANPAFAPDNLLLLQPGDFLTAQGASSLFGSSVTVSFDAVIGTLDLLPRYLMGH
jgi:hypothetical protein